MGRFDLMKDAKKGFEKNYPKGPGRYLVRIDENGYFDYKGLGGIPMSMWKVTVTILAVEYGDSQPGEVCTIGWSHGGNITIEQCFGRIKSYIMNVLQCEEAEVNKNENVEACLLPDGPLNGLCSVVSVTMQAKKKGYVAKEGDGGPPLFTTYSFGPACSAEDIAGALNNDEKLIAKFFPNGIPGA